MDAARTGQRLTMGAAIAAGIAAVLATAAKRQVLRAPHVTIAPTASPVVGSEKRCFDALRPVFAKPAWKITIERGLHDCFGSQPDEAFDIDSDGHVLWKARGMPDRRIELSLGERPLLEGIVGVSCRGEIEPHQEMTFLTIYAAGTSRTDADWPIEWSPARETLEMLTLRLKTRYADERREKLGTIKLDVRARDDDSQVWYRARVADDILLVTRGTRVLVRRALTKDEIVELVDWLGYQPPARDNSVRGSLIAGDHKIPVTDTRGPVLHYVGRAIYCDSHHDTPWACP